MGKEINMRKEGQKDRHPRTGGLIEFSIRKLSQGQGDSLRSLIYRRLVEEHGGIANLINLLEGPKIATAFESTNYGKNNYTKFPLRDFICRDTHSRLNNLHSDLLAETELTG